ncbi:MAG: hypothetical protein NVSMB19_03750 [Vulcanimicrobiaceae bacterium]
MKRRSALLVALVIAVTPPPAYAGPAAPAAVCSDGSRGGATISLRDAFARPIDDVPALRFIAALAEMDAARRRDVLANVAKLGSRDLSGPADAESGCITELSYRTVRALALVANLWRVKEGDGSFALLTRRVEKALASLADDAALAPFALHASDLSAERADPASCEPPQRDARTNRVRKPAYPVVARYGRASGSIMVKVELNRDGLVRSATDFRANVGDAPGAQSLIDEAVLTAAATTYDPEVIACKRSAGAYLFRIDFSGKD